MNEAELKKEREYLQKTKTAISELISSCNQQISNLDNEAVESLRYVHDQRLDPVEIAAMRQIIRSADQNQANAQVAKRGYEKVLNKPFFAKIMFKPNRGDDSETIYIGVIGITHNNQYFVIDWRTPVSSLYYFSDVGETSFDAPRGKISVNLQKKRQFKIENGELQFYIDTETKIDDELLVEALNKNSSIFMTNIVETIQREQNELIRQSPYKTLIVNGVAGSGKTSVGIHRLAYLLYANKNLKADNMVIISPNKLFSSYISQLLPELGEDMVSTLTFNELLAENYGGLKKAESRFDLIESLIGGNSTRLLEVKQKYQPEYLEKLKAFLTTINKPELFSGIDRSLYPNKDTHDIAMCLDVYAERLIDKFYPKISDSKADNIKSKLLRDIAKKVDTRVILDAFLEQNGLSPTGYGPIRNEDIPSLAYISMCISGKGANHRIKHVFVDEMQDYDAVSLELLRNIYPNANMTMVGDFDQNLIMDCSNEDGLTNLFPDAVFGKLCTSYRSTSRIFNFAAEIIGKKGTHPEIRKGTLPEAIKCKNQNEVFESMRQSLSLSTQKGIKTAILAKSKEEAILYSKLFPECRLVLSDDNVENLESRQIITTAVLCKGLEFDKVIIPNVSSQNYNTQIDRQILYVLSTRALHNLECYFVDTPSPFIPTEYITNFQKKTQNPQTDILVKQ